MFIGHFGVAFAAKRVAQKTSLGTLFLAAQFIDVLWPVFVLTGVEHVRIAPGITKMAPLDFYDYPISHSLLMTCAWAVVFAGVYWLLRRDPRAALALGTVVVSHWCLDALVHRPDLPLVPGMGRMIGLGLWNHVAAAVVIEFAIFAAGVLIYLKATRAKVEWELSRFGLCACLCSACGRAISLVRHHRVCGRSALPAS